MNYAYAVERRYTKGRQVQAGQEHEEKERQKRTKGDAAEHARGGLDQPPRHPHVSVSLSEPLLVRELN